MGPCLGLTFSFLLLCLSQVTGLSVAKFFTPGMVLQEAPIRANIYGTYEEGQVSLRIQCSDGDDEQVMADQDISGAWVATLSPRVSGSRCNIEISDGVNEIVLDDVLFGDVWVCAGQSNMGWVLGGSENRTEEVEDAQTYTNIRFYHLDAVAASEPQDDLVVVRSGWEKWNDPKSEWPEGTEWEGGHWASPLHDISAICFLYARELSDHLGNKPFGLIASAYAGTRIDAWSPPEALAACDVEDYVDEKHDYNSNSYLYNSMIHPLQKMSIKGVVWYQGESSTTWNPEKYICTLPSMIGSWRKQWSTNSGTNEDFPVGVVQLGPWKNPPSARDDGSLFPLLRWHQTLDYGYLPNPLDGNMFLGLALDTYRTDEDGVGQIHPKNKQLPAKRLGIAGLNVAYGMKQFPTMGPFPVDVTVSEEGGNKLVAITYDESRIQYNPHENSGFFLCCGAGGSSTCRGDELIPAENWNLIPLSDVVQSSDSSITVSVATCEGPSSIGYLWAESPVTIVHGLPLYSTNRWGLPANPWWSEI